MPDEEASWAVTLRVGGDPAVSCLTTERRLTVGDAPQRQLTAALTPLVPEQRFQYVVTRNRREVFRASGVAPPRAGGDFHAVVLGDIGDGSGSERGVASAIFKTQPGLMVIPGDIAYPRGTQFDYLRNFFPVYNSDRVSPLKGVPLMRSVPVAAVAGNHDIPATRRSPINLSHRNDSLAYYYSWVQPSDGPRAAQPPVVGGATFVSAFKEAAGDRFPGMGNFSFDWGAAHWLMLDSNPYVDWTDPTLRKWVADDLEQARDAAWRFVVFHHPPFQSSALKTQDQWMRVLVDVLEKGRADLVFSGHIHNYQRSRPTHFEARRQPDGRWLSRNLSVAGTFKLDLVYDGQKSTCPDGPIYIVTGGGGPPLANVKRQTQPKQWQPFTARYITEEWSFTAVDVSARRVLVQQIGMDGRELDRFIVTHRQSSD